MKIGKEVPAIKLYAFLILFEGLGVKNVSLNPPIPSKFDVDEGLILTILFCVVLAWAFNINVTGLKYCTARSEKNIFTCCVKFKFIAVDNDPETVFCIPKTILNFPDVFKEVYVSGAFALL